MSVKVNDEYPVSKDDVIFDWQVPESRRAEDPNEDIAARYIVVRKESATGGIVIYGYYTGHRKQGEWLPNPTNCRPLVDELLKRLSVKNHTDKSKTANDGDK